MSAEDAHFARLKAEIEHSGGIGSMLIRGIKKDEEDETDEDEEVEKEKVIYTAEQLSYMRHIIITARREACLEASSSFATVGQDTDGMLWFDTHTGNLIIQGIPKQVSAAMKQTETAAQFDSLFALTYSLGHFESWMHDNEEWEDGGRLGAAIKLLGSSWKKLLKHSDAELGIDSAFTRPGIEALLDEFASSVDGCESIQMPFTWK